MTRTAQEALPETAAVNVSQTAPAKVDGLKIWRLKHDTEGKIVEWIPDSPAAVAAAEAAEATELDITTPVDDEPAPGERDEAILEDSAEAFDGAELDIPPWWVVDISGRNPKSILYALGTEAAVAELGVRDPVAASNLRLLSSERMTEYCRQRLGITWDEAERVWEDIQDQAQKVVATMGDGVPVEIIFDDEAQTILVAAYDERHGEGAAQRIVDRIPRPRPAESDDLVEMLPSDAGASSPAEPLSTPMSEGVAGEYGEAADELPNGDERDEAGTSLVDETTLPEAAPDSQTLQETVSELMAPYLAGNSLTEVTIADIRAVLYSNVSPTGLRDGLSDADIVAVVQIIASGDLSDANINLLTTRYLKSYSPRFGRRYDDTQSAVTWIMGGLNALAVKIRDTTPTTEASMAVRGATKRLRQRRRRH